MVKSSEGRRTKQAQSSLSIEPITDIAELKAYIGVLLAMNQNIDLSQYENYFRQDESKWLLPHLDSISTGKCG